MVLVGADKRVFVDSFRRLERSAEGGGAGKRSRRDVLQEGAACAETLSDADAEARCRPAGGAPGRKQHEAGVCPGFVQTRHGALRHDAGREQKQQRHRVAGIGPGHVQVRHALRFACAHCFGAGGRSMSGVICGNVAAGPGGLATGKPAILEEMPSLVDRARGQQQPPVVK